MHRRVQSLDAGRACVGGEPVGEDRAHAAVLPVVGDREGDIGIGAVADQARNPDRLVVDERDEGVVILVDATQQLEIGCVERRLGTAEPEQARPRPEPVEYRLDDLGLASPERPDRDFPDHFRVHETSMAVAAGPPHRPDGPSCSHGPSGPVGLVYMDHEIRFLDFEGARLAYSSVGEGTPIVFGPRWVSHLEEEWADPRQRAFYNEVAKTHRVLRFDRVGCGLSSRELEPRPTIEAESRQLEAVIDAAGEPAIVFASSCCCLAASQLAVRRPDAVSKLVYFGGYASRDDIPEVTKRSLIEFIRTNWTLGAQMLAGLFDPHASGDEIAEYTRQQRRAASAEAASVFLELDLEQTFAVCCRRSRRQRWCSTGAMTVRCRSAAAASSRRCFRTRGSCHCPVTRTFRGVTISASCSARWRDSCTATAAAEADGDSPLTSRETEVLRLVATGMSNRQIRSCDTPCIGMSRTSCASSPAVRAAATQAARAGMI